MILYYEQACDYANNLKIKNFLIERGILDTLTQLVCYDPRKGSFYNRKGAGVFPLKNNFINVPGFAMPDYDPNFAKTWAVVTDERCVDLRSNRFDRPWIILWSGGIDSTNVVAAIIKNLPRSDFENITIACNSTSIWENPHFFYKLIEPNFKIVDSHWTVTNQCIETDNYLINGELADQLHASGSFVFDISHDVLHNTWHNHSALFDLVAAKTDAEFAVWFCDFLITNSNSVGVPINSLHDASWWSHFNFNWVGVKMRMLHAGDWSKLKNAKVYFDKFMPWFENDDYQRWAMVNNIAGEKFGSNFSEAKLAAKKYIYDVDNNNYYRKYKTKMGSNCIQSTAPMDNWCCMLDNYDLLNLRDHGDQILELLPDHLN